MAESGAPASPNYRTPRGTFEQRSGPAAYRATQGLGLLAGVLLAIALLAGALNGDFLLPFAALIDCVPLGGLVYLLS